MQNHSAVEHYCETFEYDYINTPEFSSEISTHTHNGWEFLLVKSGELTYTIDGSVYHIMPNSLIISRPGAIHTLYPKGSIHYERHDLLVVENLLRKAYLDQIPQDLHVLDVSGNKIILSLFEKIDFYLSNLQGEELDILLQNLINELWINIYLCTQLPSKSLITHSNAVVTRVVNYIKEHIKEPLTVQQICQDLFLSPSYLHHCFAKHMNVTPKHYIMLQKLQIVQQALSSNANPTEICRQYGFRSYSTFFRNYQKLYGCRPSDIPKNNLRKIEL